MNKKLIILVVAVIVFLAGCGSDALKQKSVELEPVMPITDEDMTESDVPEGCVTWFDGCNTCQVGAPGGPMACTMMACMEMQEPYCMEYEDGSSDALQKSDISIEVRTGLENAMYKIEAEDVILVNGVLEQEMTPGSTSKIVTQTTANMAEGDLQQGSSATLDGAVVLTQNSGGSGTFYYVGSVLNQKDKTYITAGESYLLGDRIVVKNIVIKDGKIIVTYLDRMDTDAMTVEPTIEITKRYTIKDYALTDVTSANISVSDEEMVGSDRDEHGCIGSAGYSWDEEKKKCVRPWEENE